jgi:hybrid cluster-associated redox disulfide protein
MQESALKITKDFTFGQLLEKYPKAGPILYGYGLHCIGCHIGVSETIEQGAMAHGLDNAKIDEMIDDLNKNAVN